MAQRVEVRGEPRFPDFQAVIIPGLEKVPTCDEGRYITIVSDQHGECFAVDHACIHPLED